MGLSWDIPGPRSWPLRLSKFCQQRRIDYKIVTSGFQRGVYKTSKRILASLRARLDVRPASHSGISFGRGEAILLGFFASRYASYSGKTIL